MRFILRLLNVFRPHRAEPDLAREVEAHLALLEDEHRRGGLSPDEARLAARRAFGSVELTKDQHRDARSFVWIDDARRDLLYALRTLRRGPGFAATAILTLALGIGATTAIFSVVYGVLLRPLPFVDPDRIVAVFEVSTKGRPNALADPNFDDFRDQSRSFQAIAKYTERIVSVSSASQVTRTHIAYVSPDFTKVFGVQPIVGRSFTDSDATKGAAPTALVSYGYWKQYLGAPQDLAQARLSVDRVAVSVLGVLPPGFGFPADADLWLPTDLDGENPSRTAHNHRAVGRLRESVTVDQASRDISAIARRIHDASPDKGDYLLKDGMVMPLHDSITSTARSPLLVLLGAVGFLLLVACANAANLLLARASARETELALRNALGAGRGRLVRQFVTEALLLSLIGGGLGVIGAVWAVAGFVALAPASLPRLDSVSISVPVLAFAVLLSTAIAVGLGAFTAVRATYRDLRADLAEGGRSQAGSHATQRAGRVIAAAQMAITLVLVVGAGLLGRSLLNVLNVNPGFRLDRIVAMDVALPRFEDPARKARGARFFADLIERIGQIPGVRKVGATSDLPLTGGHPDGMFALVAPNEAPKTMNDLGPLFRQKQRVGVADFSVATDGYFQALDIPLVRGRIFDARDGADAPHVAVITQSLARDRWPDQDPIGRTIEFGNMDGDLRLLTIVGIVADTHDHGLDAPPRPTVYVNLFQRPRATATLAILSDGDTELVTTAARGILHEMDPEIPARFRTISQVYAASLGSRRFNLVLIGFFGIAALVLAVTGVSGVMAYSVSRRTREIGVRVALGAATGDVLWMILSQGLRTVLAGLAIGVVAALALTRFVASLLFGLTATDPLTFIGVTLLLFAAALVACYVPARRATNVDPIAALRAE
jgi:putative ABC transport system permease protein